MMLTQDKHFTRRSHRLRRAHGMYIIELLVALSMGTLITFALLNALGTSMRHASHTQNELIAHAILRELHEYTRDCGYQFLYQNQGSYQISPNNTGSQVFPVVRNSQTQLDFQNQTWNNQTQTGSFKGLTDYTITQGPALDSLLVTMKVSWTDNTVSAANSSSSIGFGKSISESIVVHRFGTNAYDQ